VTEGEDKPLKYPVMFKAADLVLLTKCDLVPHLDVDLAKVHDALARVMPRPETIEVSARSGKGMDAWVAWLDRLRARVAPGGARAARPHAHDHGARANDVTMKLDLATVRAQDPAHDHGHDHAHGHGHSHDHPHDHDHPHAPEGGRRGR